MRGYLYILSNPAFPDLLKVGKTADTPESRVRQLNSTGVPSAFIVNASFMVNEPAQIEAAAHKVLADFRHSKNREFFNVSLAVALETIFPLVLKDLANGAQSSSEPRFKEHDLTLGEVSVLQVLFTLAGSYGLDTYRIRDYCGGDNFDINIALANMHAKKLVARRGVNESSGPRWITTPKGVKLIADHHLVDDWMRRNSGA